MDACCSLARNVETRGKRLDRLETDCLAPDDAPLVVGGSRLQAEPSRPLPRLPLTRCSFPSARMIQGFRFALSEYQKLLHVADRTYSVSTSLVQYFVSHEIV